VPGAALCALSLSIGLSVSGPTSAADASTPTPLIIDTDIFSDADDVGALATAFALQMNGEDQVIAITVNTRSSRPSVATKSWECAAAIAQYYNSSDVPIGADMGTSDNGSQVGSPDFLTPCAALAAPSTPAPDSALNVLRSALEGEPDGSVVIAEIGYEENLQALLNSSGGSALVAQKVKMLVVMGGHYPSSSPSAENNFAGNPGAAADVATNWPTKVVYSGYEVGSNVFAGHTVDSVEPARSPVRAAFDAHAGAGKSIPAWDLTAMYHAVRPSDAALAETGPGTNVVDGSGNNVFTTGSGSEYYLSLTDATGLESSLETLLDVVPPEPVPVDSSPPSITGVATEGQMLTETHGSWSNSPSGYVYQWQGCDATGLNCSPIPTATGQTYTLTSADIGSTIRVVETASNAGGSGNPATSGATAVVSQAVPVDSSPPAITGVATQGQTLTATHGSWSNNPSGYAYQWQRCDSAGANCHSIAGATRQTYALAETDVGSTIRVVETASNAGGSGAPATSGATVAVSASNAGGSGTPATSGGTSPSAPANASPPSVSSIRPTAHLAKVRVSSKHGSATFHFTATGDATGFQCALVRQRSGKHSRTPAPKYSRCSATKTFNHLEAGQYVLYVRAVGPAGASKTPAVRSFKIT
jgi:inosine-uridine nucleoside N-ribohydrolase